MRVLLLKKFNIRYTELRYILLKITDEKKFTYYVEPVPKIMHTSIAFKRISKDDDRIIEATELSDELLSAVEKANNIITIGEVRGNEIIRDHRIDARNIIASYFLKGAGNE